jgi:hypothetical protein
MSPISEIHVPPKSWSYPLQVLRIIRATWTGLRCRGITRSATEKSSKKRRKMLRNANATLKQYLMHRCVNSKSLCKDKLMKRRSTRPIFSTSVNRMYRPKKTV